MLDAEVTQDQDVLVLHLKWMGVSSSLVEQMPSADHKMELVSVIVLQVTLTEIPTKAVLQSQEVRKLRKLFLRAKIQTIFFLNLSNIVMRQCNNMKL